MDERAHQIRQVQLQAIAVVSALLEADDIDLWLEANNLATRAVMAALVKRANGPGPHEDGQGLTS
jgi:hypothetical protein